MDRRNPMRYTRLKHSILNDNSQSIPDLLNLFAEAVLRMRDDGIFDEGIYLRVLNHAKDFYEGRKGIIVSFQNLAIKLGHEFASNLGRHAFNIENIDGHHFFCVSKEEQLALMLADVLFTTDRIAADLKNTSAKNISAVAEEDILMHNFFHDMLDMRNSGEITDDAFLRITTASQWLRKIPHTGVCLSWKVLENYIGTFNANEVFHYLFNLKQWRADRFQKNIDCDYSDKTFTFKNEKQITTICSVVLGAEMKRLLFAPDAN